MGLMCEIYTADPTWIQMYTSASLAIASFALGSIASFPHFLMSTVEVHFSAVELLRDSADLGRQLPPGPNYTYNPASLLFFFL